MKDQELRTVALAKLEAISTSPSKLATVLGCSRQRAHQLLHGSTPGADLEAVCTRVGIRPEDWHTPEGGLKSATAGPEAPPVDEPSRDDGSALEGLKRHAGDCTRRRAEAERAGVTGNTLDRLVAAERRALVEVAKLTELTVATEAQLCASPRFIRITQAIVQALVPHREAARDVLLALQATEPEAARAVLAIDPELAAEFGIGGAL